MTLGDQIAQVRLLARVSPSAFSDTEVMGQLNRGMEAFAKDVRGLQTTDFITITPKFNTRSNFALHVATDTASATVAITAASRTYASGTVVASDLETALQTAFSTATITVTWSTSAWALTVNMPGAISIAITSPSRTDYVDATDYLFGGSVAASASSAVGVLPENCTYEESLPSDYLSMTQNPEWDGYELAPAKTNIFSSPQYAGDPMFWQVSNKKLRLSPYPRRQKSLQIFYRGMVTEYASVTATTTSCALPSEYHMAPVFYAASMFSEGEFDTETANRMNARYMGEVTRYNVQSANQVVTARPITYREFDLKVGSVDAL